MRGGTKVHQTLEDEVHATVQVTVSLKEEAFALRLWNLIQGLRTLRTTGLTRELEVWGTVEGQVINGVIDELSYTSPDLGFEQELSQSQSSQSGKSKPTENQSSITDYLDPLRRRVYLTDVKTRGSARLPSGAALRPSRMQLFMYHRLLGDMAAGRLDFPKIVSRYGLQLEARFSDAFMAQIGSLHDEVFDEMEEDGMLPVAPVQMTDASSSTGRESPPPPNPIKYRSIAQILPLVQAELSQTFPQGADTLGDLVAIVYRHRDGGRIIGNHIFPTDHEALSRYLNLNFAWWLGRRSPEGVPIEEAYKCRMCEFAESCEWRKEREDEIVRRSRVQTSERTHALGGE
jgi:exonuclease V